MRCVCLRDGMCDCKHATHCQSWWDGARWWEAGERNELPPVSLGASPLLLMLLGRWFLGGGREFLFKYNISRSVFAYPALISRRQSAESAPTHDCINLPTIDWGLPGTKFTECKLVPDSRGMERPDREDTASMIPCFTLDAVSWTHCEN